MALDQAILGRRVKSARESFGYTQEQLAGLIGISRPSLAQVELGRRGISSIELDKLAQTLGRDVRDFLSDDASELAEGEEEEVQALFRSQPDASDASFREAVRACLFLGNRLAALERDLGLSPPASAAPAYPAAIGSSKWDAIQVGAQVAREERRRLGLGSAPAGSIVHLLEAQVVRTGSLPLPAHISGLMIAHPEAGLLIVVNERHARLRQRFSWCHEYAHVLLDRQPPRDLGRAPAQMLVSRVADRDTFREVRANAFAANFLLPDEGVLLFLSALGKGTIQRAQDIYDESGVLSVDTKRAPDTQQIQLYDVVQLAHYFGVSRQSALYRLRNLRLLTEAQLASILAQEQAGAGESIADALRLPKTAPEQGGDMNRRFVSLGLEAHRRGRMNRDQFIELAGRAQLPRASAERLLTEVAKSADTLKPA